LHGAMAESAPNNDQQQNIEHPSVDPLSILAESDTSMLETQAKQACNPTSSAQVPGETTVKRKRGRPKKNATPSISREVPAEVTSPVVEEPQPLVEDPPCVGWDSSEYSELEESELLVEVSGQVIKPRRPRIKSAKKKKYDDLILSSLPMDIKSERPESDFLED
jgi:hypothetical protein